MAVLHAVEVIVASGVCSFGSRDINAAFKTYLHAQKLISLLGVF